MTDVAAPHERDPEIREAFLSLALRDPLLQKAPVILKDLLRAVVQQLPNAGPGDVVR